MRLALDLSTTATGWALGRGKTPSDIGTISPPAKMALPFRLIHVVDAILATINEYKVEEVYAEESHYFRGAPATRALLGLRGALIYALQKQGIPVFFREQKQGYNAIGLKGNAKKPEVTARCKTLGFPVKNDNEADAIAVFIGSKR